QLSTHVPALVARSEGKLAALRPAGAACRDRPGGRGPPRSARRAWPAAIGPAGAGRRDRPGGRGPPRSARPATAYRTGASPHPGKIATVAVNPCRKLSPPTGPISPAAKNPAAGAPPNA